jgi:hypothetical protein
MPRPLLAALALAVLAHPAAAEGDAASVVAPLDPIPQLGIVVGVAVVCKLPYDQGAIEDTVRTLAGDAPVSSSRRAFEEAVERGMMVTAFSSPDGREEGCTRAAAYLGGAGLLTASD